jgi:hypothetical protein
VHGSGGELPVSLRGAIMIGGQKIQVILEANTRALRHVQRRRAFELVSAQQRHSEVLAQNAPGGLVRLTLGHENSYDAVMPECQQVLPVAEYLTETDPELIFLVVGDGALDFRHEDSPILLPCQVKIGPGGRPRRGSIPALLRALASSFWVSVCPRRPRSTSAGSTLNGSRLPDSSVTDTWR